MDPNHTKVKRQSTCKLSEGDLVAHICISGIFVVRFKDGSDSIAKFMLGKIDCSLSDLKRTQMTNDIT